MTQRIVISIEVPDGVTVQVANGSPAPGERPVAAVSGGTPACPHHGPDKVKPSKFGGFYCTAVDESTEKGYCTWKQK